MTGICATAYVHTSKQNEDINGFKSCELWSFEDNIFRDENFATTELTEEACPVVRDIDQVDQDKLMDNMQNRRRCTPQ